MRDVPGDLRAQVRDFTWSSSTAGAAGDVPQRLRVFRRVGSRVLVMKDCSPGLSGPLWESTGSSDQSCPEEAGSARLGTSVSFVGREVERP